MATVSQSISTRYDQIFLAFFVPLWYLFIYPDFGNLRLCDFRFCLTSKVGKGQEDYLSAQLPSQKSQFSLLPTPWPIALSIAGFDPSAGAGILADLKTFAAHRVYGMACITALTVQNTQGVQSVQPISPSTVNETLHCLAGDVRFAAIKIGMLATKDLAEGIVDFLSGQAGVPVVLDPVMISSSGRILLDLAGQQVLRTRLLARANWITPNLNELAALTGSATPITREEIERGARMLLEMAAQLGNSALRVVVTGGHADSPDDLLMVAKLEGEKRQIEAHWFPGERIETRATHGTGCTFSSAIAAQLALNPKSADVVVVAAAKAYVAESMSAAYPVGQGNGPLNHFWK